MQARDEKIKSKQLEKRIQELETEVGELKKKLEE